MNMIRPKNKGHPVVMHVFYGIVCRLKFWGIAFECFYIETINNYVSKIFYG